MHFDKQQDVSMIFKDVHLCVCMQVLTLIPGYFFSNITSLIVLTDSNTTQFLPIDQINEGH